MKAADENGSSETYDWETGKAWLPTAEGLKLHSDVNTGTKLIEVMVVELERRLRRSGPFQSALGRWAFPTMSVMKGVRPRLQIVKRLMAESGNGSGRTKSTNKTTR